MADTSVGLADAFVFRHFQYLLICSNTAEACCGSQEIESDQYWTPEEAPHVGCFLQLSSVGSKSSMIFRLELPQYAHATREVRAKFLDAVRTDPWLSVHIRHCIMRDGLMIGGCFGS